MLEIKKVSKQYKTGDLVQNALSSVSLEFRSNEFVAVLGPSGSGKTTLLNIIGGLDRYDSGDLVINGVSTKQYTSRDWDTYRNHTVGFVFQSYNLIPHQSVLSNVELALTLSGVSKQERRRRACEALEQVGLKGQEHKRPNQMSGGQMQRVAIARALVNNPDILLADEPTGALDSETGTQVMELLKKVAKDRLVIMVTHNAELAEQYATRIVKLHDGQISSDTNPVSNDERTLTKEKEGGPDVNNNSKLRQVVAKCKAANMPNDTIDRAIKKAASNDMSNYESVTYEGYGPNGTAIIVEALTDNRNRAASNIRSAFTKGGGNVGTPGCVSFMFDNKGQMIVDKEEYTGDADELMMLALDAGADDFNEEEDCYEILTSPEEFDAVNQALADAGVTFASAEVTMIPQTTVDLTSEDDIKKMNRILGLLDEDDDVQNVYHNWNEPEEDEE